MTPGLALSVSGLCVERLDQTVDSAAAQDRSEFRPAGGELLADRSVEIDVGDLPNAAVIAHQIAEIDRLAIRLDDLACDDGTAIRGPLAGYLEPLAGIAVKPLGVDRRNIALKRLLDLLPLDVVELSPIPDRLRAASYSPYRICGEQPARYGHIGRAAPMSGRSASSSAACHKGCAPYRTRCLRLRSGGASVASAIHSAIAANALFRPVPVAEGLIRLPVFVCEDLNPEGCR